MAAGTLTVNLPEQSKTDGLSEKTEDCPAAKVVTRYQSINELLIKAEAQAEDFEEAMMSYGKKLDLLDRLLKIL